MEWKEYEEITRHIYETLGKGSGVKIECYGNNCKVFGKSGVPHQVDVLTSHSDGLHSYKTMVECKYWDKNISKDIVMKVAEIVEDAGISKGVIVSKNGYTPDAIAFAKYKNIGLIELRSPNENDWKGRIKNIQLELIMLLPNITKFEYLVDNESLVNFKQSSKQVDFLYIKHTNGQMDNIVKYIDDFNSELCKKDEKELFEKTYKFNKGTFVIYELTKEEIQIIGLKLEGHLKMNKNIIYINGEEHIFMIMKSVFEDKTYTITKDHVVKEAKNINLNK